MSQDNLPLFERLLEQTARRLSAAGLHPLQLRDNILESFESNVQGGDAPNDIRVALHPGDFQRLRADLPAFRAELLQLLSERCRLRGYRTVGERRLRFVSDSATPEGTVRTTARFSHQSPTNIVSRPSTETRRLIPIRNLNLRLPGGERSRVTHLPFFIGRGPENDLVLASMAVSRSHAEITRNETGLILRDMGSRNGIVVDGERHQELPIAPGTTFTIGDIEIRIEREEA